MEIRIDKNEFEYLVLELKNLHVELDYKKEKSDIILKGEEYVIEELLDKISDLLSDKGFDSNSNLTQTGVRLEKIIDKISNVFYD